MIHNRTCYNQNLLTQEQEQELCEINKVSIQANSGDPLFSDDWIRNYNRENYLFNMGLAYEEELE